MPRAVEMTGVRKPVENHSRSLTGVDLRVVVFHRLPQPLESSANTAELSTFPQPDAMLDTGQQTYTFGVGHLAADTRRKGEPLTISEA